MRWNEVYVGASAAHLGVTTDLRQVVAEGRYDADEFRDDDYESVRVASSGPAVGLAVEAARLALERAGEELPDVALLAHASCAYQGLDHFAPASYIQHHTVGGTGTALEIKQFSNGGLAALGLAAGYLTHTPGPSAALLTTSDVFAEPDYDRYRSDKSIVLADGGTALVLTHGGRPGVARLLSTSLLADAAAEGFYHGAHEWNAASGEGGRPLDLRARRTGYLAQGDSDIAAIVQAATVRQQQVVDEALADADTDGKDVACFVFPNVGRTVVDWEFRKRAGIEEARTAWQWGRTVGHLGAGDQFAGLTHLLESGQVHPGDKVALAGIGMGFTFGCAVFEILEQPEWSTSAR
ncbi:ketoacyl-ACP synthase III family protein [Streptomyces sp. P6-2-1]|uniref:ketoacyl-ACP synthase III family protein n=1 Tax=unclassified Streptomyces TaxID=2593676 RepID=UPI003D36C074